MRAQAVAGWKALGSQRAAEEYVSCLHPGLLNISFSTAGLPGLPPLARWVSQQSAPHTHTPDSHSRRARGTPYCARSCNASFNPPPPPPRLSSLSLFLPCPSRPLLQCLPASVTPSTRTPACSTPPPPAPACPAFHPWIGICRERLVPPTTPASLSLSLSLFLLPIARRFLHACLHPAALSSPHSLQHMAWSPLALHRHTPRAHHRPPPPSPRTHTHTHTTPSPHTHAGCRT